MGFLDAIKHSVGAKAVDRPQNPGPTPTSRTSVATDHRDAAFPAVPHRATLLFVGTPEPWCQAIRDGLHQHETAWEVQAVAGASEALPLLRAGHFFAVVMDDSVAADPALQSALPKESGYPLRLVVCDSSNRASLARLTATGATAFPRGSNAAALLATLHRLERVQDWMGDAGMKKLLAQCRRLPTMPRLYSDVAAELGSPEGSLDVVARLIAQDPVMTAKILQVVNSAFFGLGREITEPYEAVLFLGAERTRSLVLLAGVFTQFEPLPGSGLSAEQIWNHSLLVGNLARTISVAEVKNVKLAESAFTAGLIHDIGKLVLLANVPAMCRAVQQLQVTKQLPLREAELQVLGTTHAELGACLLGTWGIALPVLEAVAWHHHPTSSQDTGFSLLTAVHAANVFAHEADASSPTTALPERFDHEYLLRIDCGERRNDWRKACGLPLRQEEDVEHARIRRRRESKFN